MDRNDKERYDPKAKSKYKKSKYETNLKDEIKPPCNSSRIFSVMELKKRMKRSSPSLEIAPNTMLFELRTQMLN
jgi:hypothetical protein